MVPNMYIDNMEERLLKYEEYWEMKNHDRPLISVCAPNGKNIPVPEFKGTIKERRWDEDYVIARARAGMASTYYAGESLPTLWPNLGPDIFSAYLGSEILYEESTSYAESFVENWKDVKITFSEDNVYWKKICAMTDRMLNDSKGDYIVGLTDLHEGMDALVSMRGPEKLCMDIYDEPDEVKRVLGEVQAAFKTVLEKSFALFEGRQKGTTCWMDIYHPGKWYVSSSDFIYLISPETFEEFSRESIRMEAEIIGNNIYHLDGIGSKRHLDRLLEMPEINGIQWVYGAGQPTAAYWIDVLKKIQDAGKMIEISCVPGDMEALFSSGLKPEGVRYSLWAESAEQADAIIKQAEEVYKKSRVFI